MSNPIECLVNDMMCGGKSLTDIAFAITKENSVREVYRCGMYKFKIDRDDNTIDSEGPTTLDGVVILSECNSIELAESKFREYFDYAIYMDLSEYEHHIINEIKYSDLNLYDTLFQYIWSYLKIRIKI